MAQQLFGRKVLLENLDNKEIIQVNLSKSNRDLIPILKKHQIKYQLRDDSFFKTFAHYLNHQGVVMNMKASDTIKDLPALINLINRQSRVIILVIDEIKDPQNFGSILRTCEAMQVDAVIYKKDNQVQINDFEDL